MNSKPSRLAIGNMSLTRNRCAQHEGECAAERYRTLLEINKRYYPT